MSFTPADLQVLAADARNFKLFPIRQESGKLRAIQEPKRKLQAIHKRIHKLLARVVVPDYLHSAVAGRSYLTNAYAHDPSAPAVKMDVKQFFPSVPRKRIFTFFRDVMNCRADVAGLLADLLTFNRRLPTGSSASPIIAFYAFKSMFDRIEALAKANGLQMTCYVDDMCLSGPRANKATLAEIREIIASCGLRSHKACIFSSSQPKVVTGVCNTPTGRKVPNKLLRKIKLGFETLKSATTPEEKRAICLSLLGRLYAAGQIDPKFKARAATFRSGLVKICTVQS
jgi:RNA-directed DNA polymerase